MERGTTMLVHSLIMGALLYAFMVYVLGQPSMKAEDRSILISAVILIYMVLFGHGLPSTSINPNIY